jgi:diguanylate cyclase (GGDEF)-like protein/PAS domain S-box-containing protein
MIVALAFALGAGVVAVITWRTHGMIRRKLLLTNQRAREESRRFKVSFESGISGMSILDTQGDFLQVNRSLCEMLGYSEEELLSSSPSQLTHPEDLAWEVPDVRAAMADGLDVYSTEKRYLHRDGGIVWAQVGLRVVRDDSGEVEYFLLQVNNITSRKRFEQELAHSALHDDLTGLPNRRLFLDRLEGALARLARRPVPLTVLFVDLDRFKLVNDTFGHATGDTILAQAGERLARALRAEDTVARFGGDEFTILCEGADEAEARRLASRILTVLAEPFTHDGREFQLSASIGARVDDSPHTAAGTLLQDADVALYAAKQKGGARVEFFHPAARGADPDLLATEQALRYAIAHDELRLHYQPALDLASDEVVAIEALVRWQHPQRGLLGPFEFVPLAEQSELIVSLGEWVLCQACTQMAAWRAAGVVGEPVLMAVNVSARQLSDSQLASAVAGALERTGLDPSALCLEVTENALFREPEVALANLRAIKALGVSIALDDFGVGFSSLSRLRELPGLDVIKIDRSFVSELMASSSGAAVISAAVSLGAHLDLTVVAEGIEDEHQRQKVQELGCHVGQGYLFSRPEPPERIAPLLSGRLRPAGDAGV